MSVSQRAYSLKTEEKEEEETCKADEFLYILVSKNDN
jgi:hypothetical protein